MSDIRKCYDKEPKREWNRLIKDPFHNLEFQTTMHYLKKHLPKKGLILDAGGGPGRYTIALAKMGYSVVLLDYSASLLEVAKKEIKKSKVQNKVKDVIGGSIVDLSMFKDNTFDAVICLGGPLGHVKGNKNREKAISELKRIVKKNKPIFVSVIGRLAVIMHGPAYWPHEIKMTKHFKEMVNLGDDTCWHGKYYSHLFLPEEMEKMFTKNKIKLIETTALEGISTPKKEAINKLAKDKKFWNNWMWAHYKLCTNPHVVATSEHFMVIGKK